MKIKGKTILVTGGFGNIGSYIVDQLINNDAKEIVVVDNLFNANLTTVEKYKQYVTFYPIDIGNITELEFVFNTHPIDCVFHCASMLIQDSESLPQKAIATNINGTFNIIELSNTYNISKICYSSSASVYGEPQFLPVTEDHPFQYKNFVYGWTKITAEMIFQSRCKVDWVGFRYYNVYSERMNRGAFYTQVFPIFYDKIMNGQTITLYGDGKQTMDLIHAKDIARANILGLKSEVTGEFFNVGTGIETTAYDLATTMMKAIGKTVPIEYKPDDSQKVKNRRSSTVKINTLLGFTPQILFEDGITRYVEALKANQ